MRDGGSVKTALATLLPFDVRARGATLGCCSSPSSFKASAVIRVDGILSVNGSAIVMFNPSPANDATCVWYSTGQVPYNDLTFDNSPSVRFAAQFGAVTGVNFGDSGLTGVSCTGLPFSSRDLFTSVQGTSHYRDEAPNVRARVVSSGAKVTFSGSTLNDGGIGYALVEPNHDNLFLKGISSTLSKYTSTKVQRLALRKDIEINMFPITKDMCEYSGGYDDVANSYKSGLDVSLGYVFHTDGSTSREVANLGDSTTAADFYSTPVDSLKSAQAATTVLYPLSRRNSDVRRTYYTNSTSGGSNPYKFVYTVLNNGTVSWNCIPPPSTMSGAMMVQYGAAATAPVTRLISYDINDAAWFMSAIGGGPSSAESSAEAEATGYISYVVSSPPVIGAISIMGGPSMAGSTFHIEYIVHCEYTGIGVQGRTQTNIPDEGSYNLIAATAVLAREINGQNEKANLSICVPAAVSEIMSKVDPHLGQAVIEAVNPQYSMMMRM